MNSKEFQRFLSKADTCAEHADELKRIVSSFFELFNMARDEERLTELIIYFVKISHNYSGLSAQDMLEEIKKILCKY